MKLYHGSDSAIPAPSLARCRPHNDYGQGFYCTQSFALAGEWACQKQRNGFVNAYDIDLNQLSVIDLNSDAFNILHWLAVLLENRLCRISTPTMARGARWLATNYPVDLSAADVVKGYRADDSYFFFARAFLRNEITLGQLACAMHLGELGEQYMVKSPAAFSALRFSGCEPVASSKYWPLRQARDRAARDAYQAIVKESATSYSQAAGLTHMCGEDDGGGLNLYISTLITMRKEEIDARLR